MAGNYGGGECKKRTGSVGILGLIGLLCACSLTACDSFERHAVNALGTSKAVYESINRGMTQAAVSGALSEDEWAQYIRLGNAYLAAHNTAMVALQAYDDSKTPANQAKARAALEALPLVMAEINLFVTALKSRSAPSEIDPGPGKNVPL